MKILWAAIGAALLPTPATAQPVWRQCVVAELQPRDMTAGSVGAIGVRIAVRCRPLYDEGPAYSDVGVIVGLLEKLRSQQPKEPEMVIEPPKKQPKGDSRF